MRRSILTAALALALISSTSVLAQTAATRGTAAGADELLESITPFVGQAAIDAGIVSASPEPGGYRLTLDFAPLLSEIDPALATVEASPYSVLVSRRPDGDWNVSGSDPMRVDARFEIEGEAGRVFYEVGGGDFAGVWSPELGTFLSAEGTVGAGTMIQTDPESESEASFGETVFQTTATRSGPGEADLSMTQSTDGMTQDMRVKPAPEFGGETFPMTMAMARIDNEGEASGMRTRALLDLWAFGVANFDETGAKVTANQEGLRAALEALLPLWNELSSSYEMRDFSIETPYGSGSADTIAQSVSLDGIEAGGTYVYAFVFEGLDVSSELIPAWAAALIPEEMRFSISVDDLDLETPTQIALADFDLTREEVFTTEATERMAASFSENPPRFRVEPSVLRGRDYEITVEGSGSFDADIPESSTLITARGLDAVIAQLQKAGTNEAYTAVGSINFAKGFGKANPDGTMSWAIETKADGAVLINGVEIVPASATDTFDTFDVPTDDTDDDFAPPIIEAPAPGAEEESEEGGRLDPATGHTINTP